MTPSRETPRTKRARTSGAPIWAEEVRARVASGDAGSVEEIGDVLKGLLDASQERLRALRVAARCDVVLVESSAKRHVDPRHDAITRVVHAQLEVGPKRTPFRIDIKNEDCEDTEETSVECDPAVFSVVESEHGAVEDEDIEAFLGSAGLEELTPKSLASVPRERVEKMDASERRRWMFADVMKDVMELIVAKYGDRDKYGVGLGIERDSMYSWLNLKL